MITKTVVLALALSAISVPAFADCSGHKKVSADSSAATTPTETPVLKPRASS